MTDLAGAAPPTVDGGLSWSEAELPQHRRTKHVHRLHPYLGKFVPQLAEALLRRHARPGATVYDPFAGSGTTLVEANVLGMRAIGTDISAFNCLLMRVKTGRHDLDVVRAELSQALGRPPAAPPDSDHLHTWLAPPALRELAGFCRQIPGSPAAGVLSVVASRAARSARRVPHHALDWANEPVTGPYACHKHRRECRPVEHAAPFLRRYAADTLSRLEEFSAIRTTAPVEVLWEDARRLQPPSAVDLVLTSPPYPGVIDYHDQHRYAYELLGLADRSELELGAAAAGSSNRALRAYCDGISETLAALSGSLRPNAAVVIVVNDRHNLYEGIAADAGFSVEQRLLRHVNRRTGRRAGAYYEEVLTLRRRRAVHISQLPVSRRNASVRV
jgi:hypothetical protein